MLKNRSIPFGYCVVNGSYALNAAESEAVQKIFCDYIGGKSLKIIASEMKIPYNTNKAVWNKNMVCRVLENKKYIGENGYPQIIEKHYFEQAARIKIERTTYRKPDPKSVPIQTGTALTEYNQTEEIIHMANEINRLLDSENPDKKRLRHL